MKNLLSVRSANLYVIIEESSGPLHPDAGDGGNAPKSLK